MRTEHNAVRIDHNAAYHGQATGEAAADTDSCFVS